MSWLQKKRNSENSHFGSNSDIRFNLLSCRTSKGNNKTRIDTVAVIITIHLQNRWQKSKKDEIVFTFFSFKKKNFSFHLRFLSNQTAGTNNTNSPRQASEIMKPVKQRNQCSNRKNRLLATSATLNYSFGNLINCKFWRL